MNSCSYGPLLSHLSAASGEKTKNFFQEIFMPIFEFVCEQCNMPFEELVRSSNSVEGVVCPKCSSPQVKRKISTFASKISGGSSFSMSSAASSCSTGST
jgi:putative FmdB family regulatory protein